MFRSRKRLQSLGGLAAVLTLALPISAWAQGEEKAEEKPAEKVAEASTAPTEADSAFKIKRGLYAEGDIGVFFTFGGKSNNLLTGFPNRTTSNAQPYVGITVGYDIVDGESFSFGLGLKMAMGLSGGAGRIYDAEVLDAGTLNPQTKSADFNVIQLGVAANIAIMVTDRLAIPIKVGGGAGFLNPDPTIPADQDSAGKFSFAPYFDIGAGVDVYTLLNDFSIGLFVRFTGVIAGTNYNIAVAGVPSSDFIPGLSITAPIKYTF